MVDMIDGALYIGSAAILYKGITKENILTEDKIKHGTIGALLGLYLGPKLEKLVKDETSLTKEQKEQILKAGAGAVLGGLGGYAVAKGAADNLTGKIKQYFSKEKK